MLCSTTNHWHFRTSTLHWRWENWLWSNITKTVWKKINIIIIIFVARNIVIFVFKGVWSPSSEKFNLQFYFVATQHTNHARIHPCIHFLLPALLHSGSLGCWSLYVLSWGRRRLTPLQITAGPHRDKQPVNFTSRDNLHLLISARPCSALCEEAAGPGGNQCRRRMKWSPAKRKFGYIIFPPS